MCILSKPAHSVTRKPTNRFYCIVREPTAEIPGVVRLTVNGKSALYLFCRLPIDAAIGSDALELVKIGKGDDDAGYHVHVNDGVAQCDCIAGCKLGAERCKHAAVSHHLLPHCPPATKTTPPSKPGFRCPVCGSLLRNVALDRKSDFLCVECDAEALEPAA